MEDKFEVYDEFTGERLFESDDQLDCMNYIMDNYDEGSLEFDSVWTRKIKE